MTEEPQKIAVRPKNGDVPPPPQSSSSVHRHQTSALFETMLHLTTVIHTFIFAFLVLILYICFANEWSFFVWHPFLMTIAWWLLASEGILLLRKDNIFSKRLNHQWKIRLHWFIQFLTVACNIAGFSIAYINKNRNNRDHFTSYHGKFGLTTLIVSLVGLLAGTSALYSAALRKLIKPSLNKALHICFGIFSYAFAIVALLFVVYSSGWFKSRIEENDFIRIVSFIAIIISSVWISLIPLGNFFKKIKSVRS